MHEKALNHSILEQLVEFGKKIVDQGLVAGAGGNISAREGSIIWMKPSGFAMDELTPDDFCGMSIETGSQQSGRNKPTSEVSMHMSIYRVRPDVNAIFHTHSPWASGVISAGIVLRPMFAEFVNDLGHTASIPYVTPTSQELAEVVASNAVSCDTLFLANHGIVALGSTMKQAFYRCLVVEHAAISLVAASIVGSPVYLTQKQADDLMSLEGPNYRLKIMKENSKKLSI